MRVKRIRSGRGLGDTLYMQSLVRYLVEKGEKLQVCTDYPEIFDGTPVTFDVFSRHNIDYLSHYTKRKSDQRTNQWQDICLSAGVEAELKIDWKVKNKSLVNELLDMANGRKILFVHGGREPMARKDKFGRELLPDGKAFNKALGLLEEYFRIQVGDSELLYTIKVDQNLNRATSVTDMLDIASVADAFYGQCSFIVPLAESFDKKLMVMWASKGIKSQEPYIATITPKKILSKPTSHHMVDDWDDDRTAEAINAFRDA